MLLCISIIVGIASLIGFIWTLKETEGIAIVAVFSAIGIFLSIAGLSKVFRTKPVVYDFPADEYVLEYKIVIIGEKSDTTYILTKIKEE